MLLNISKLLILQMITTTTLISVLLLSSCCSTAKSLPITSKPIESTAENLAWEAWLMVPVGQQQKSRKVTPKSIFIVPQKKNNQSSTDVTCPPGQHWSQNKCIPTVKIDTDKALLNQLGILAPFTVDYDYDYEEESPGAEKLEGSADANPFSIIDSVDEPLKFNIFRDTFPIGSFGSGDSSGSKDTEDENVFFVSERRRRPPTPPEMVLPDLDADSSSYGPHNQSVNEDLKDIEEGSTLFMSGIDAILVPAVDETKGKGQNMSFSIYKEASNTTVVNNEIQSVTTNAERKPDLEEILENESLILDKINSLREQILSTTTEKTENLFDWETTTMKLEEDEDVESKTEFTRSVTNLGPTDDMTNNSFDLTIIPREEYETTTEISKEDITTITEPKEDISTTISAKGELTTIVSESEDMSTITSSKEEITETSPSHAETTPQDNITIIPSIDEKVDSSNESTTVVSSPSEDILTITNIDESSSRPNESANRDSYSNYRLTDENSLPPVIDISAELRKINDLVARNSQPTTTTAKSSDLLSKIILTPSTVRTSSEDPIPPSSTSTVWSSNSTSRNILSNQNSSSIRVSSTTESQVSSLDPSSSTSPTPEINEPDPYWWLPTGWGTDRSESERPLLLRFWSALSGIRGSQTKV